ncbi:hypothetical protein DWX58_07180 [Pseudoflavonifractor sp. AF19-9AC]|uniref:hypothetical protein n=1 Tax=Pseudoflavonifractor sp. AF19-9AC TaxID=2292244 RepID=UPI000E4C5B23|nr:hypothetical protein [Pseudoflavonifractor sp. AF19-9AC]RHR10247.1 hypothetical protein DWX58_07180 [Pseudoflavonifractor sp. AF19-9AC]
MKNENFDIHDITAEVIQNATEQVRRSNESMVPPFPPIKDEWLMYEKMEEFVHLQKQNNEILQDIEKNTANLKILVDLIHNSVENQDQIISIMAEILAMAKANNKDEADSLCKRVMSKISDTVQNVETMIKIMTFAKMFYNIVQSRL